MPTFRVYLETGASLTVTVEAADEGAAIEEAFANVPRDICANCSGWGQNWSRELGEWDVARNGDGTDVQPERKD